MTQNKLAYISGSADASKATIVVGGIHDTYQHFMAWEQDLGASDTLVVGFDHDHRSSSMAEAGHELAQALRDLNEQGINDVTVIAHSMGGLVSKAALDELVASGDAQEFKSIDFHALGTPWGGFAMASFPGAGFFGDMLGYPMTGEMAPGSDFMKGLSQADWPENMSFNVYQGSADNVSLPSVLATHERYDETTGKADLFVTIEGYNHDNYVNAGPDLLKAGWGTEVTSVELARDSAGDRQPDAAREYAAGAETGAPEEREEAIEME